MTATILKTKASQPVPAARTIQLTVPHGTPDPKFSIGQRVGVIIDDNPDDPDTHAGVITAIELENCEWSYRVLPGDDEELRSLCNCGNPEDFAWFDEDELQRLTNRFKAKIKRLLDNQKSYEQRRAEFMISAHKLALDNSPCFSPLFDYKENREEWNELMSEGYIPENLGYMPITEAHKSMFEPPA